MRQQFPDAVIGRLLWQESPEIHHLRPRLALVSLRLKAWPSQGRVGIKEQSGTGRLSQVQRAAIVRVFFA